MKKVFVFGNPLVEKDCLALKVAERLKGKVKGVEFEAVESLDDVKKSGNLCIMDVVFGIEKVQWIEGLDALGARQPVSLHDFDLAMELKLLKKIGKIGKVKIIGIPAGMELEKAAVAVMAILCGFSSSRAGSALRS